MKILDSSHLSAVQLQRLLVRTPANNRAAERTARRICRAVKQHGNAAVRKFSRQFDGCAPPVNPIPPAELQNALRHASPTFVHALKSALRAIHRFHKPQLPSGKRIQTLQGVTCWRRAIPIPRVGLYVPAGSAPLPSTVLMLGVPAILAGCDSIALCTPPTPEGRVNPMILAAACLTGIREVYPLGGAQAIAAMAFGTESVPKVHKIFGPGNKYVNRAKQIVATDPDGCPVDMPAGPSEILVIADRSANPAFVAADLISQAEHDADARVVLVTPDRQLARGVLTEIAAQVKDLPRRGITRRSLAAGFVLITGSLTEAVRFANDYAPEHLSVQTAHADRLARDIRNAGSVFLGPFAPVAAGDYASGTNHTLPTGGTAVAYSGLTVEHFQKTVSFQSLSRKGFAQLAETVKILAAAEGLEAHRRAITVRQRP
ncbi:MAG: histidinol dehydrogenase [Bacteroidota bacterium]